jgi:hypothetical protein
MIEPSSWRKRPRSSPQRSFPARRRPPGVLGRRQRLPYRRQYQHRRYRLGLLRSLHVRRRRARLPRPLLPYQPRRRRRAHSHLRHLRQRRHRDRRPHARRLLNRLRLSLRRFGRPRLKRRPFARRPLQRRGPHNPPGLLSLPKAWSYPRLRLLPECRPLHRPRSRVPPSRTHRLRLPPPPSRRSRRSL